MNSDIVQTDEHRKRVFPVRLTAWSFLFLSLGGWLRLAQTVLQWNYLSSLNFAPGPFYLAACGIVWGAAGLPAFYGLMSRKEWAVRYASIAGVLYPLSYWLDRLVIWRWGSLPANLVFAGAVSLVWLLLILWGLRRSSVRRYFQES